MKEARGGERKKGKRKGIRIRKKKSLEWGEERLTGKRNRKGKRIAEGMERESIREKKKRREEKE